MNRAWVLITILLLNTPKSIAEDHWEKVLNNRFITSLQTTERGILAGEYDSRLWNEPFNGIYLSEDLGETWQELGLRNRGVKDIIYADNIIYAATYYTWEGSSGLFSSKDLGSTWEHLGYNFPLSSVELSQDSILVGTYSHGIWVSFDKGGTWVQTYGSGWTGPSIYAINCNLNTCLAAEANQVLLSKDNGKTWKALSALSNKGIRYLEMDKEKFYAGSISTEGIYTSDDMGETWVKNLKFGNFIAGSISALFGNIYTGKLNENLYSVVVSKNEGHTWENLELNTTAPSAKVTDFAYAYLNSLFIYTALSENGVYRIKINSRDINPIFSFPIKVENPVDFPDKITSYFDHMYPLLGYEAHNEPEEETSTTVNYLGIKESEPTLYYSSHNGYDIAAPIGTPVLAVGDGVARYSYCKACGNTIKIAHENGYVSGYMHLSDADLVTKSEPVQVQAGDKIGIVGMTGNTSGPHLHFYLYENAFPDGLTDPFGWQDPFSKDPWNYYTWADNLGEHSGNYSSYLWKDKLFENYKINVNDAKPTFNNLQLKLGENTYTSTLRIFKDFNPTLIPEGKAYLPNTSYVLENLDILGNKKSMMNLVLEFALNPFEVTKFVSNSLSVYYFNTLSKIWEKMESELDGTTLRASTSHLSKFAVFGKLNEDTNYFRDTVNINSAAFRLR